MPLTERSIEVVVAVVKRTELRSGYSTYFENRLVPKMFLDDLPDGTVIYARVPKKRD